MQLAVSIRVIYRGMSIIQVLINSIAATGSRQLRVKVYRKETRC
jgi:hypothetical protein